MLACSPARTKALVCSCVREPNNPASHCSRPALGEVHTASSTSMSILLGSSYEPTPEAVKPNRGRALLASARLEKLWRTQEVVDLNAPHPLTFSTTASAWAKLLSDSSRTRLARCSRPRLGLMYWLSLEWIS